MESLAVWQNSAALIDAARPRPSQGHRARPRLMPEARKPLDEVAFGAGALADSSLMQRKVSEMRRMICASPSYLETAGVPKSPEDLADHRVIALSGIGDFDEWPFCDGKGAVRRLGIRPAILSDTAEAVLQLGLSGAGIFRLGGWAPGEAARRRASCRAGSHITGFSTWTAAIAACARVRRFHR